MVIESKEAVITQRNKPIIAEESDVIRQEGVSGKTSLLNGNHVAGMAYIGDCSQLSN